MSSLLRSTGFQLRHEASVGEDKNLQTRTIMRLLSSHFTMRGLFLRCMFYEMQLMWETLIWGCEYFPSVIFSSSYTGLSRLSISFSVTITQELTRLFFFPDTIPMHIYFQSFSNSVFLCVCLSCLLTFSLCVVLPERLCDGPSSPCRPQATSCWAPPATLSSCWRRRREQRRAWRCHRRAGSGSCRACCWARYPIDDGLKAHDGRAKTHTEETGGICLFMSQCAVQTFQTVSSHSHL